MKIARAENTKRFKDNPSDLNEFIGTEQYHKNANMVGMYYTDGVKHMAQSRDAYWLLNLIYIRSRHVKAISQEPFITAELSVEDDSAVLVFTDGNNNILHAEDIEYTDYPDEGVCLWLVDGILLLPSEY
jgi:hypothetical protein